LALAVNMTSLRLIATFALGAQLLPLGVPLVCGRAPLCRATAAHHAMPPGGPAMRAPAERASCVDPLCAVVTPTAVAAEPRVALAPSPVTTAVPLPPPVVRLGESPAPLSPPPQA
jgi:hypothetical protein